jgi:hypothetical protein
MDALLAAVALSETVTVAVDDPVGAAPLADDDHDDDGGRRVTFDPLDAERDDVRREVARLYRRSRWTDARPGPPRWRSMWVGVGALGRLRPATALVVRTTSRALIEERRRECEALRVATDWTYVFPGPG